MGKGVFPNKELVADAGGDTDWGIRVDPQMCTSLENVYAAGDVRSTPLRQIATAVGDAALATFSAGHYLQKVGK